LRLFLLFLFVRFGFGSSSPLSVDFYSKTCPTVESVVRRVVTTKLRQTLITVPGTLRLYFHDCMVTGCDASTLIASPDNDAEKDAPDNLSLAGDGFDTVIKAKTAVEAVCPGVVSCADILALAARDVVFLAGGPTWKVELGRRDGLISSASLVAGNLPEPTFNLSRLEALFARNNLSRTDVIALSGAHTVGFSHCTRFADRLYSFDREESVDPTLNGTYARELMLACPPGVSDQIAVTMDPTTPSTFDNVYYRNLMQGKGMFTSDQVLFTDPASRSTVVRFARDSGEFNGAFANAMVRLGRANVKTGNRGQIRRDCTAFN
ncbi:hypothetical protein M569_01108, partial [Genlisea aurea]